MPREEEYRSAIRELERPGLCELWRQIEARQTPDWEPGKAFEYLVLRAFELENADVQYAFRVTQGDQTVEEVDGVIYAAGLSAVVECKDSQDPTTVEPIAKLRNQLLRRPSPAIGIVFARCGFSGPAYFLAQFLWPQTILLWEGEEFADAMRDGHLVDSLRRRYRYAVERGLSDYDPKAEE